MLNAYTKRCNNRHPSRLLRSLRECNKRRSLIRQGVHFVAGSEYMRDVSIEHGDIPGEQISVVLNAIDGTRFSKAGKRPNVASQLDPGYILYAGRIAKSKGIRYLLEAYAQLEDERPKLVIAGDGHHRPVIEQHIGKLDLESEVVMAGWQSGLELVWLYKNCGMVVVPSVWAEVFGNVGLEAMAASKPVVAFDVGGISQWLVDGETGFLVPPKDVSRLTEKISCLLDDPALASEMGQAGHARFHCQFTTERQASELLKVYGLAI